MVFGVGYALVACAHVRFDSDSCANPTNVKSKPLHAPCTHQSTTAHLSPKDRTCKPVGDDWADCGCSNNSSSSSSSSISSSSSSSSSSVITSIVPNPTGHITPATNSPRQSKLPLQGKNAGIREQTNDHMSRASHAKGHGKGFACAGQPDVSCHIMTHASHASHRVT